VSSVDEAVSYIFTWHSLSDACPKCRSLNGQEFRDQDLFQERLFSHIWGDIWDLNADHTLAHPNCRCQLDVRVEVDWFQVPELVELQVNLADLGIKIELPIEVYDFG